MDGTSRRTALKITAGSVGALLAGCLGDGGPDPGSDGDPSGTDGDPGGGPPNTTEPGDGTTPPPGDVVETATLQLGGSLTSDWWTDDDSPPGRVVAMGSEERADAVLDPPSLPDETREQLESFLSETDFRESLLMLVESVGPSTCYGEIGVENVGVENGTVRASARAVDTSGPNAGCGQAITHPAALVRVTVEGTPPDEATITVTDGWGDSADLTASVDGPLGPDPDDLAGAVRPDGDPPAVPPALTCEDASFERNGPGYDEPAWGLVEDEGTPEFALRTDTLAAAYGDTVTITMTNVSDRDQYTGNRHKYNLEVHTEAGWQDVRGTTTDGFFGYTDEALSHPPGEGFEWSIELTEAGIVAGHPHEDHVTVCPDLGSGRYRFVFWEPSVAVAFDLTRA